jgi:MtrB/PioB family decaheme-associated outer membrane protein
MRYSLRHDLSLFAVSALAGIAAGAAAEEQDAYQPLVQGPRVISDRSLDSPGIVQLGLGWSSSDSFMFGEYNGLHEEGGSLIGKLQWQDFSAGDSYWQVSLQDVGLDTREGIATWGKPGKVKLSLGFDSQLQVRNDSGRTPFLGKDTLTLPGDWQSGRQTGDWAALDDSLYNFDRELERNRYFIELDATLAEHWHIESSLSYEEKEGTADVTGAIYTDASGGDAVSLPQPIDYRTTEFDLGIGYTRKSLQLQGTLFYSDFDNRDNLLTWQNPYSSFGPDVRYPQGIGGLGTAPDSEQLGGRFNGQYIFNPGIRLQFDGSYSITEQDQDYPGYTVNQNLEVFEPLPRTDFDGELATGTFGTRLLVRASRKLDLEGYYKVRDRDYDGPRDGYRYNRGDGADQPRESLTIYNSTRDFTSQTMGIEGSYRLPLRSRLKLGYAYKVEDRRNAAVEETEEDIYSASYRIQPRSDVTARIELVYSDRSADTYHWDQSYFALLDTALINATPDNQRYITHPELSQYHLSNREQTQVKIDLNYLPTPAWRAPATPPATICY